MTQTAAIEAAQRKIAAIDKRIDAVRAEMYRVASINPDAFDYDTTDGQMVACSAFHNARRDFPGFVGLEDGLSRRRWAWMEARDNLIAKEARAAERRAAIDFRKRAEASRHVCPTCGDAHYAPLAA